MTHIYYTYTTADTHTSTYSVSYSPCDRQSKISADRRIKSNECARRQDIRILCGIELLCILTAAMDDDHGDGDEE